MTNDIPAFLAPGMMKIDPQLTERVNAQFAIVNKLLDTYRDPSVPGGYKIYTAALKASDGAKLSKAIQALQEPLSKIAEKVATVDVLSGGRVEWGTGRSTPTTATRSGTSPPVTRSSPASWPPSRSASATGARPGWSGSGPAGIPPS